jgi:DNA-binding IclR family transcriptional regulator
MTAIPIAPDTVLTVSRGMQVLRAFRSDRARLGNAELVRRTGLPKASVSRMTGTLVQLGFLRRPPGSREFELATGALAIGHAFLASNELLNAAEGTMQELADQLGLSVALAIGNGLDMLYVGYRASQSVGTLRLGVGTVLPIGTTSVGNAYLWAQPPEERARLLAALELAAGTRWPVMSQGIGASFFELERTGTCGVVGKCQRDAYAVALPIRVGRQQVIMGLSCGKAELRPDMELERRRINPALKDAAAKLEARLADFEGQI